MNGRLSALAVDRTRLTGRLTLKLHQSKTFLTARCGIFGRTAESDGILRYKVSRVRIDPFRYTYKVTLYLGDVSAIQLYSVLKSRFAEMSLDLDRILMQLDI